MQENGLIEIKDFTLPGDDQPLRFKIRDDVFEAVPIPPLGLLPDIAAAVGNLKGNLVGDNIEKVLAVFDVLLYDESAALLRQRTVDKKKPIGDRHILPIVFWLLESYGLRPTEPSSNSSDTSEDGDGSTTSTVGASPAELTSQFSGSLAS